MKRLLLVLSTLALTLSASAATPKKAPARKTPAKKAAVAAKPAAPVETAHRKTPYVGAISVDAATGRVLFEDRADAEAYPASVTKLMTLLLVMEDVKAGKYSFDDRVEATADAYRSEPSWVGIKVGEKMSVRDLCAALMVESANDAAIVLGVHSAGSFDAFVARMNARAAELGMARTKYYNPNGLPPNAAKRYPWKSFNVSTARDQAVLARTIVKMPEVMKLTSIKTCDLIKTADGFRVSVTRRVNEQSCATAVGEDERIVKQLSNHNNLMRKENIVVAHEDEKGGVKKTKLPRLMNPDGRETVDGLKTGYIDAGGSSIVLTGQRKGKRVIVVILGSDAEKDAKNRIVNGSAAVRDREARRLLEDALGSLDW